MNKTEDLTTECSVKGELWKSIVSSQNIYNAIYCMESYVFEKGLLSDEDLELYTQLLDKFNFKLLDGIIGQCRNKIEEILENPDKLFDVKVYFKIKKWEKGTDGKPGRMKYRPLHTADLIDQICMVSMLMPLMFSDGEDGRKPSALTKIIPHNFYGNIPSTNLEYLFKPWLNQYKAYNDNIIQRCKDYQKNHKYRTELTLDIKNFFPSISPEFIFSYVKEKLQFTYTSDEDKATLDKALTKLLFFKINKEKLMGWESEYYSINGFKDVGDLRMNVGIAQGLPQSYFFGNICMIEIRDRLKSLPIFHNADASFYVDDSVIYIERDLSKDTFKDALNDINNAIGSISRKTTFEKFNTSLAEEYIGFQANLEYGIRFHDTDKSDFCEIEKAGFAIAGLEPLSRAVSNAASVFANTDETEDEYNRDKLEKIQSLIDDEMKRLKQEPDKAREEGRYSDEYIEKLESQVASRLKLLKRYKRFYLYRLKFLERRLDKNSINVKDIDAFYSDHSIGDNGRLNGRTLEEWMDGFEENIFQTDSRMLISMLPVDLGKKFVSKLCSFESSLVNNDCNTESLYFKQDWQAALYLKGQTGNTYVGLMTLIKQNLSPSKSLSHKYQKGQFEEIVKRISNLRDDDLSEDDNLNLIFPEYVKFALKHSDEFVRRFLNVYYSIQQDIEPSDARTFIKFTSRGLHYTELRMLTRLRNKNFKLLDFQRAVQDIDAADLDNRMGIDMGLLEIVSTLISKVGNPDWVDNIILTHRVVKGLWYNGSKFMNSYTLHNEEHAITLIKAAVKIVKAIDYLNLKQTDWYILFLACYLHDISMVIHPNMRDFCNGEVGSNEVISSFISEMGNDEIRQEKFKGTTPEIKFKKAGHYLLKQFDKIYNYFAGKVRDSHAYDSAAMIRLWKDSVLKHLEPLYLNHVADVAESHGWDAKEVYGQKSKAKTSLISEKYMMIIIRLADLMDVANDRINYNLLRQNVSHMADASKFHWISHLITDEMQLAPTYAPDDLKDKPIQERKITERLNFNMFLNVKFLDAVKGHCGLTCRYRAPLDSKIVKILDEHSNYEGIMIELFNCESDQKPDGVCPMLCRWTMKKHEWLVKELAELNSYLNSVNDRWFKTEIRLNIIYHDQYRLDADLYGSVKDFIAPKPKKREEQQEEQQPEE